MQQKDNTEKNELSPRMRKLLEKGRTEAHRRVVERGIVQFRADPETMEQLLLLSDDRGIPFGTMLREWVKERLRNELGKTKQANSAEYRTLCLELKDELTKIRKAMTKKFS